jgi:hypothetical protein
MIDKKNASLSRLIARWAVGWSLSMGMDHFTVRSLGKIIGDLLKKYLHAARTLFCCKGCTLSARSGARIDCEPIGRAF